MPLSLVPEEIRRVIDESDLLYTHEEVEAAIDRMAAEITARLSESAPVVYCVMNGGLIVAGKLLPKLRFPLEAEYLHATRYGDRLCGEEIEWKVRPECDLRGRSVLLVDDVLDEGTTLAAVADLCRAAGAREVLTAVLVNKEHGRKARPDMKGDFVGLIAEDRFLFGCGMDYKGWWRNADGIYALK
jgi:hypoxanthine phosphoribosyltransferase